MKKILGHIILFFLVQHSLFAQADSLSLSKSKRLVTSLEWQMLDSLAPLPNTIAFYNSKAQKVELEGWDLSYNQIRFATNGDSLLVKYQVLPYDIGKSLAHIDTSEIRKDESGVISFQFDPFGEEVGAIDFKGLDYNGSFARGISFGNSQNLVLNSSFNLQMAGEIGDGIQLVAAISDENIPLQPEGNTQQLNEFDKVFIQLKKGKSSLIAGDYDLKKPDNYFMNYFKRAQGVSLSNETSLFKKGTLKTRASGAISKGKFARNNLVTQEGNQGPYRLEGAEGEQFIIVQSGSEKVWLDGQLLKRGQELDYVINYNSGDVTFTPKQLITKDSRIIIEFEYAVFEYLRSMYAVNTDYTTDRLRLYMNVFSEQDGRSAVGGGELDSLEIATLQNAGDDQENIFLQPSYQVLEGGFDELRVMYELVDTFVNIGGTNVLIEDVLRYSIDSENAMLVAGFSEVGFGEGDYVQAVNNGANGRVFEWVAPNADGSRNGNFRAARKLIAPQQRQMYNTGIEYKLNKNTNFKTEIALSNNDRNRFSNLNTQDNLGWGVFTELDNLRKLGSDTSEWTLNTNISYELKESTFKALNPYRAAEFIRDWNIQNTEAATEHIGRGNLRLRKAKLGYLDYGFSGFVRQGSYEGTKQTSQLNIFKNGWKVLGKASLLNTKATQEQTTFFRPNIDISKKWDKITFGVFGEREQNSRYTIEDGVQADTLNAMSIYFDKYKVYFETAPNDTIGIGGFFAQRLDYAPLFSDFKQNTKATEANLNGNFNKRNKQKLNSRLDWNLTYRQLEIQDSTLTDQRPAETYLGRLGYNLALFKGAIRSNTAYQIGSGQERKVEFNYTEVPNGQGIYQWRDYNDDGVLQNNEVEIAVFSDSANIIRLPIYTNDFIRTNNVQLNQSLRLEPRAVWFAEKKMKKIASRFSTLSSLLINRKVLDVEEVSAWNPFELNIADTSLVALQSNIRNVLFINRGNQKFDIEIGQTDNSRKFVQTTGFESRRLKESFFKTRINFGKKFSLKLKLAQGFKEQDSENFDNKDYQIAFKLAEPAFTFQPNQTFRTTISYKYKDSQNQIGILGEGANNQDFKLDLTYSKSSKTAIRANVSFVQIAFEGDPNSPIGYELLQGLQNGENYLWNISFDRVLSKNIRLNLSYEGRKTGVANVVHLGRASVAAVF